MTGIGEPDRGGVTARSGSVPRTASTLRAKAWIKGISTGSECQLSKERNRSPFLSFLRPLVNL
jgi:hypothetical protein